MRILSPELINLDLRLSVYVEASSREWFLSPSIFKMCISGILDEIRSNYFIGLSDVSYLAYADDLLLLCKSKQGLSFMVSKVLRLFSNIGLSLNVEKCEFLVFNGPTPSDAPLACRGFSIPFVSAFGWSGITITNSISCLTAVHCS